MKRIAIAAMLLLTTSASATPYFHVGFNQAAAGEFWPVAGAPTAQAPGFITPAIEHDAGPGGLCFGSFCPGIGWNPINLGYIGGADIFTGKAAIGPSVQTGELVKTGLRYVCQYLPGWTKGPDANGQPNYGALKALLAPGQNGIYADVGVYEAVGLNEFGAIHHIKPETYIGATLVKKF